MIDVAALFELTLETYDACMDEACPFSVTLLDAAKETLGVTLVDQTSPHRDADDASIVRCDLPALQRQWDAMATALDDDRLRCADENERLREESEGKR